MKKAKTKQPKPTTPTLGEQVMAARKKRRLTQIQVEERCGVDQTRVSKVERGHRPTIRELLLLAKALRCRFIIDGRA